MDDFKGFIMKYRGAIIGALIAILLLCTGFYKLIMGIILVFIGIYVGNYIQLNKEDDKEKLKRWIDKM